MPRLTPLQWTICAIAAIGFAFDTYELLMAPLIIRPALLASAMLNFVRAIESFETPAIIALPARIEVFTTKIYREAIGAFPPNQNLAATYAVSLLLITMTFVYFYRRLTFRTERYVTVTGRGDPVNDRAYDEGTRPE